MINTVLNSNDYLCIYRLKVIEQKILNFSTEGAFKPICHLEIIVFRIWHIVICANSFEVHKICSVRLRKCMNKVKISHASHKSAMHNSHSNILFYNKDFLTLHGNSPLTKQMFLIK